MRYLKRFNEKLSDEQMFILKDFCESHLAYLLDKGFTLDVTTMPFKRDSDRDSQYALAATFNPKRQYRTYLIELIAPGISNWDEIKDAFIPFMHLMIDEFQCIFKGISFKGISHHSFNTSALSVIQDRFTDEMKRINGIGDDLKITKIKLELLDREIEDSSII